ncbi:MAG: Rv3235 family protein [Actinomycetota bacterium]
MLTTGETAQGLPFYQGPEEFIPPRDGKLYLVPTTHGELFDPEFAPLPSSLDSLPDPNKWTRAYLISVVEILAGRRPVTQIARNTHRFIYNNLAKQVGTHSKFPKAAPKLRRIHRSEPIEGVIELTATISIGLRVRAIAARFEGVDRRWICTEFDLL